MPRKTMSDVRTLRIECDRRFERALECEVVATLLSHPDDRKVLTTRSDTLLRQAARREALLRDHELAETTGWPWERAAFMKG